MAGEPINPNIQRLHKNLTEKWPGFKVPLDQFTRDMQDSTNLRKLHTNLSQNWPGFKVPFDQFMTDMGYNPNPKQSAQGVAEVDNAQLQAISQPQAASPRPSEEKIGLHIGEQYPGMIDAVTLGIKRGWKGMKADLAKFSAEALEMMDVTGEGWYQDGSPEKKRILDKSAEIRSNIPDAPQNMTGAQKAGMFFGEFLPQAVGIAASIAATPATGGTSLAYLPGVIATGTMGTLVATSAGGAMQTYEDYMKEKGYAPSDEEMWGVGLAAGGAEYFAEKLGTFKRFLPKGAMAKSITRLFIENPRAAGEVFEQFARSTRGAQVLKKYGYQTLKQAIEEGGEEVATELGNVLIETIYKDQEDAPGWQEIKDRSIQSFEGGFLMGGMLSPMGTWAKSKTLKQSRERNGYVTLAKDDKGKAYEIMGQNDKGQYIGVTPEGKEVELAPETIQTSRISLEDYQKFMGYAQKGLDVNQEVIQQAEMSQAQREVDEQVSRLTYSGADQYPLLVNGEQQDDPEVVITVTTIDGKRYNIISGSLNTPDPADPLIAQDEQGHTFMLSPEQISKTDINSAEQMRIDLMAAKGAEIATRYQQQKQRQRVEQQFEIGDVVNYQGMDATIAQMDEQGMMLKVEVDGKEQMIAVGADMYGQIQPKENLNEQPEQPLAEQNNEQPAEPQQRVKSWQVDSKTSIPYEEREDGSIYIPFNGKDYSKQIEKELADEYEMVPDDIEQDNPNAPAFVKNKKLIVRKGVIIRPKQQQNEQNIQGQQENEATGNGNVPANEENGVDNPQTEGAGQAQGQAEPQAQGQQPQAGAGAAIEQQDSKPAELTPKQQQQQSVKNKIIDHFGGMYQDAAYTTPEYIHHMMPEIGYEQAKAAIDEIKAVFEAEQKKVVTNPIFGGQQQEQPNSQPDSRKDGKKLSNFKQGDVVYRNYDGRYEEYEIIDTHKDVWKLKDQRGQITDWNANANNGFILKQSAEQVDLNNDASPKTGGKKLQQIVQNEQIKQEEAKVNPEPSDAQKEAGNYAKGHINVQGFDITIENPAGSTRSGKDSQGKPWSVQMKNTYGYFRRTEGADGDQVDTFIGPNPTSERVFVVDQKNPDGSFDEHKIMLGFNTKAAAAAAYQDNYAPGWQGLGEITEMPLEEFRTWVKSADAKKALAYKTDKQLRAEKRKKAEDMRAKREQLDLHAGDKAADAAQRAYEAGEVAMEELQNLSDIEFILRYSQNPAEILHALSTLPRYIPAEELDAKQHAIANNLHYISGKSFVRFSDKANITQTIARAYFRSTGLGIDVVAQQASQSYDQMDDSITPEDVVQFILQFPNGTAMFFKQHNPDYYELEDKFIKVTGINPSPILFARAEQVINQRPEDINQVDEQYLPDIEQVIGMSADEYEALDMESIIASLDSEGIKELILQQDEPEQQQDPEQAQDDSSDAQPGPQGHSQGVSAEKPELSGQPVPQDQVDIFGNPVETPVDKKAQLNKSFDKEQPAQSPASQVIPDNNAVAGSGGQVEQVDKPRTAGQKIKQIFADKNKPVYTKEKYPFLNEQEIQILEDARLNGVKDRALVEAIYAKIELIRKLDEHRYSNGQTAKTFIDDLLAKGFKMISYKVGSVNRYFLTNGQDEYPINADQRKYLELLDVKPEANQEKQVNLPKSEEKPAEPAPQEQVKTPKKPTDYGKKNTVFTEDAAAEARRKLREKFGNLNAGIDPEVMAAGMQLAGYHIEAGARSFIDFSRAMIADIGEGIRPYLKSFYEAMRWHPSFNGEGFDAQNIVADTDVNTITTQEDVPDRDTDSQRPGPDNQNEVPADERPVPDGREPAGELGDGAKIPNGTKARPPRGKSGSQLFTDLFGEQGTDDIHTPQEQGVEGADPGDTDGRGGSLDGSQRGYDAEPGAAEDNSDGDQRVSESFKEATKRRRREQLKANTIEIKPNDADNIRQSLPILLPEQQDDVIKAERRFFDSAHKTRELAYGKGMLFTNGTGTGKTYTGLGIISRFYRQGKRNILIVVPSEAKVRDWAMDGENLGLKITALQSTKDGGNGINITTYATFRANEELLKRDFDLVVYDESHRLMEEKNGTASATTYTHYKMANVSPEHAFARLTQIHPVWQEHQRVSEEAKYARNRYNRDFDRNTATENFKALQEVEKLEQQADKLQAEINRLTPEFKERAQKSFENTKVVYLSATPFKGHFNLRYVNKTLFDWGEETTYEQASRGKSRVDPESRFFLTHFGAAYEWKFHRLQARAKANAEAIAMQEVQFSEKLMKDGVMSGRAIESDKDYSREFPVVSLDKAEQINKAFGDIFNYDTNDFNTLRKAAYKVFYDYNYTTQLFEALRASMVIPRIQKHLDMGRKVVIFHRRKQANVAPPFQSILNVSRIAAQMVLSDSHATQDKREEAIKTLEQADLFEERYAEVLQFEQTLNYHSAIEQIVAAFTDQVLTLNGDTPKKQKGLNIEAFNDDQSGKNIIVIQEEAGKEGISLHDTTGKHQRVLMSLSLPISSTTALQTEGRIYRIGQETNAIFENPLLGLDMEIFDFGNKINRKLSTTENLAIGNQARDLLRSFADGVLFNAHKDDPHAQQGIGGKEYDKKAQETLSEFRKAVLTYFTNHKKRGRRDEREGIDFYATPEPLGQKMISWLHLAATESGLEPSAGMGSIAMWFPEYVNSTMIEPSYQLFSKLGARAGGGNRKLINDTFENHAIVNKYHGVAMNPPFGQAGKLAMEHVEKAFDHLKDGGRLIALVPRGKMDERLDNFLYGVDKNGNKLHPDAQLVATIDLPAVTFEQASTSVNTRIVVIDRIKVRTKAEIRAQVNEESVQSAEAEVERRYREQLDNLRDPSYTDLTGAKTIDELFDQIENIEMPARQTPTGQSMSNTDAAKQLLDNLSQSAESNFEIFEQPHTKTGENLYMAKLRKNVEDEEFYRLKDIAKKHGGYYSSYRNKLTNTRSGFVFQDNESRQAFIAESSKPQEVRFSKKQKTVMVEGVQVPVIGYEQEREYFRKYGMKTSYNIDGEDFNPFGGAVYWDEDTGQPMAYVPARGDMRFKKNFYSPTEQALQNIKQEKGTVGQFKAMLLKNGAKQAEMDWMRFDEHFPDAGKMITKSTLQSWIDANKVEIEEVVKGDGELQWTDEDGIMVTKDGAYEIIYNTENEDYSLYRGDKLIATKGNLDALKDWADENAVDHANTKYDRFRTNGGEKYKEWLLTMPTESTKGWNPNKLEWRKNSSGLYAYFIEFSQVSAAFREDTEANRRAAELTLNKSYVEQVTNTFKSAHWDEPNVVVHMRTQEMSSDKGERVLMIEEIQSDWAQKGRKQGFNQPKRKITATQWDGKTDVSDVPGYDYMQPGDWIIMEDGYPNLYFYKANSEQEAIALYKRDAAEAGTPVDGVPDMPFKQTDQWTALAVRRMMQYAAEQGFDRIAWTTGEMQADRYDLSKQVDYINVEITPLDGRIVNISTTDGLFVFIVNDEGFITESRGTIMDNAIGKPLEDVIGKDMAEKVMQVEDTKRFSGLDLKVGGEGMIGYYDGIVPAVASKVAKQFGSKVEPIGIRTEYSIPTDDVVKTLGKPMADIQAIEQFKKDTHYAGNVYVIKNNEVYRLYDSEDYADALKVGTVVGILPGTQMVQSLPVTEAMNQQMPMFRQQQNKLLDPFVKRAEAHQQIIQGARRLGRILGVPVKVVTRRDQLPLAVQRKMNSTALYPGVYYNGQVYILASEVRSLEELQATIAHEVVAHKGLRDMLGAKKFDALCDKVYDSMHAIDRHFLQEQYGTLDVREIADEYMAQLAETGKVPGWFGRILAELRQLLRQAGINLRISDADIMYLLWESRRRLMRAKAAGSMVDYLVKKREVEDNVRFSKQEEEVTRFKIIGERGAANLDKLDKQLRIKNLHVAEKMEAKGKDALTIRLATGWEKGADGKWKYETRDEVFTDAFIKSLENSSKNMTDEQTMDKYAHIKDIYGKDSELLKAYPKLSKLLVHINIHPVKNIGTGHFKRGGTEDYYQIPLADEIEVSAFNLDSAQSILIHEIQHAIQYQEGFAIGSDVSTDIEFPEDEVYEEIFRLLPMKKIGEIMERNDIGGDYAYEHPITWLENIKDEIKNPDDKEQLRRLINNYRLQVDRIWNANTGKAKGLDLYRRSAGEVEARNVQHRRHYTDEQRRNTLLQKDENFDVPRDRQIVRFKIIGTKGARRMFRSGMQLPLQQLQTAREMEKEGKTVKEIHLNTGWERGKDTKWRYEVGSLSFNSNKEQFVQALNDLQQGLSVPLAKLIEADEIFAAYPQLRSLPLKDDETLKGLGGFDNTMITLNGKLIKTQNELQRILTHELQHAIQREEGFARGSNMSMAGGQKILDDLGLKTYSEYKAYTQKKYDEYMRLYKEWDEKVTNGKTSNEELDELAAQWQALYDEWEKLAYPTMDSDEAYKLYERTAGEVEARNAAYRFNFTPEQRRSIPLFMTEDILREDQIIQREIMDDQPSFSEATVRFSITDLTDGDNRIHLHNVNQLLYRLNGELGHGKVKAITGSGINAPFKYQQDDRQLWRFIRNYKTVQGKVQNILKSDYPMTVRAKERLEQAVEEYQGWIEKLEDAMWGGRFDEQTAMRFSKKPADASPYWLFPTVRGEVTKDKIRKYLKSPLMRGNSGYVGILKELTKFNSPAELKENIFYHGTGYGVSGSLKPSITMSEREAEQRGGGGYGERYWAISLSRNKNIASNFTGMSNSGEVYPVILKKDAKVIDRPDIQDASELDDIIIDLFNQHVDAVRIGNWDDGYSEQELAVINPNAIFKYERSDGFRVYGKQRFNNLTDEQIEDIYNKAKERLPVMMQNRTLPREERERLNRGLTEDIRFKISPRSSGKPMDPRMVSGAYERTRETLQDKMLSMKNLQSEILRRGGLIPPIADVWSAENRMQSRSMAQIDYYNKGPWKELENHLLSLMDTYGLSLKEINQYLKAKSSLERNDNEGIQAISDHPADDWGRANVERIVQEFEDKVDPAQVDELWQRIKTSTDYTIKTLYQSGVLSRQAYEGMLKRNYYVPLRSWAFDENENPVDFYHYVEADRSAYQGLIKAKGRGSEADDPLAYIQSSAHSAIVSANLNQMKQRLLFLARMNEGMDDLLRIKRVWLMQKGVDNHGNPILVNVIKEGEEAFSIVRYDSDGTPVLQYEGNWEELRTKKQIKAKMNNSHRMRRPGYLAGQHEVEVWENGERYIVVTGDANVALAVNNKNVVWPAFTRWMQTYIGRANRWLTSNFTAKNPAFIPINWIRDYSYASIAHAVRKDGNLMAFTQAYPHALAAIHRALREETNPVANHYDKLYELFRIHGGETGYVHLQEISDLKTSLERDLKHMRQDNLNPAKWLRKSGELLNYMALMSENSARFATFVASVDQGKSYEQAATDAKNITVNFNRKGRASGILGSLYGFFNATIQGGQNFANMAYENKGRFAAAATSFMAVGFLLGELMRALGDRDEEGNNEYMKLPKWVRQTCLVIPTFGNGFITIPLPPGFRSLYALGVIGSDMAHGDQQTGEAMMDAFSSITEAFSPLTINDTEIEKGKAPLRPAIPTTLVPFYDLAVNQDFTGKPIYKVAFTSAQGRYQAKSELGVGNVNQVLKTLTRGLNKLGGGDEQTSAGFKVDEHGNVGYSGWRDFIYNWNPSKMEHVLEYYLGGRGKFWNDVYKTSRAAVSPVDDVQAYNIPVLKRLYRTPYENTGWEEYFELKAEVQDYEHFLKLSETMDDPALEDKISQNERMADVKDLFDSYEPDMKELNDYLEIATDPNEIKELREERTSLIKELMKEAKQLNDTYDKQQ